MLKNLRIASPCTADWKQMQGDNRVRHCAECNLNVYNFAEMTTREINELVARREGRICARLYRRADGTIMTRDCPVGLWVRVRRISRFAGATIAAAMCLPFAFAQTGDSSQKTMGKLVQIDHDSGGITVKVLDLTGAASAHAEVQLIDANGKQVSRGTTDAHGLLRLSRITPGSYTVLAHAPGWETNSKTVIVKSQKLESVEVTLEPRALMGDVVEVPRSNK